MWKKIILLSAVLVFGYIYGISRSSGMCASGFENVHTPGWFVLASVCQGGLGILVSVASWVVASRLPWIIGRWGIRIIAALVASFFAMATLAAVVFPDGRPPGMTLNECAAGWRGWGHLTR